MTSKKITRQDLRDAAEKYKERVQEGNFGEFNRKTNPEDAKRMTYSASADRAGIAPDVTQFDQAHCSPPDSWCP